ncbi:MAG TPA: replication factor C small subunit [Candidatus Altiarchaeales archaeon]|nr:MAG: replication factor C small subunit [Candidatus Altiarchaeales archaeon]HDN83243.1 replication factor C small subunit [Candidatus Altiarchaeales archaeon]
MEEPWTEKYRPKKLDDIIGQKAIVERLKAYVKSRSMPHLLFAGPAGSGKTTAALCLAYELFGDIKGNFLELNASDERGIDVVRGKIKDFARTKAITGDFKIIFLDEADALTPDAQNALRRTMENYTRTCRFILSCNYSSKIIEPIQSRCAIFRFRPLSKEDVKSRLRFILENENISYEESGLDAIVYVSEGDMRRAINLLQSAAALGKVTEENVFSIAAAAKPEEIRELLSLALEGKFLEAREMLDKLLLSHGMSGEDILLQMNKEVMNLDEDDEIKVRIIDLIGETNFTLVEGANERIQLEALISRIMSLKK